MRMFDQADIHRVSAEFSNEDNSTSRVFVEWHTVETPRFKKCVERYFEQVQLTTWQPLSFSSQFAIAMFRAWLRLALQPQP